MKVIGMGKYAPSGIKAVIADPQARVTAMKALVESLGGTWIDGVFVRGPYDFIVIADMPNEESVAALHAVVYASGAVDGVSIHTEIDVDAVAAAATGALASYSPPS